MGSTMNLLLAKGYITHELLHDVVYYDNIGNFEPAIPLPEQIQQEINEVYEVYEDNTTIEILEY